MKKLLSIITIVLFISVLNGNTATMAASEKKPIMGDVDQSGQVDAQDAVQILKYVAHNIELSDETLKLANTDGIGKVDAQDAVMILKYVAHNITEFPGKLIDFEALDVAKIEAAKYVEDAYSAASYNVLKNALAMPETTQLEIDVKAKAIIDAISKLTTDKSALNTAKTEANKYKEENYSKASYNVLKDALSMPETTQKEIDSKAKAITSAIAGLTIDRVTLNAAKTEASKYKEQDYSISSYKALKDALSMPETTQKQIDNKSNAITSAIAGLNTDTSKLSVAKIEATKYVEEDYSVASYNVLKNALAMLEKTQAEIDAKATAITNAIAGLTIDKTALNTAKVEAAKYKEEDYSKASYNVLKNALAMPDRTQKEIDNKAKAITNAIAGLTRDKTELNTAKADATNHKEEDYSVASYKKLKDALKMPETTQKEIDSKAKAIIDAIAGLTRDKTALNTAKANAANHKEEDYSVASYKKLKDALEMLETTQKEIDIKAKAITDAISKLTTDKTALNTAKTNAANRKEEDYSVASYKKLKDAMEMPETTQKEIDSKAKAITDAISKLTIDKTALNTVKTEANKYNKAYYSVASYEVLENALAMPDTTQKEIDSKTTAITTAINGLEKKLAHVNVTPNEENTGIRYKELDNIATITSGDDEEKIKIEDIEFNVIYKDSLGNVNTDQDYAIKSEYLETNNRVILVKFTGNKAGTYTIKVNVGDISGTQEIKVTVNENEELNYAKLNGTIPETIRVNEVLSELEIEFYHKYTDTELLALTGVKANDLTIEQSGMEVTLHNEGNAPLTKYENNTLVVETNDEVKYVTIKFTKVGEAKLKINNGEQLILEARFDVKAEAVTSVKLYDKSFENTPESDHSTIKEINTINLYTSEQNNENDIIKSVDDDGDIYIYTLIPMYIVDGDGNRNKVDANKITSPKGNGDVKVGYYDNDVYDVYALADLMKYHIDETTKEIREATGAEKVDYIGISAADITDAETLKNGKIKFIYKNIEYSFDINVK